MQFSTDKRQSMQHNLNLYFSSNLDWENSGLGAKKLSKTAAKTRTIERKPPDNHPILPDKLL